MTNRIDRNIDQQIAAVEEIQRQMREKAAQDQADREHEEFERAWRNDPKYAEDRKRDRAYLEHMDGRR